MWILAKDVHASALDAEQFRDVFVAVQTVRDKERDHDDIDCSRQPVPIRDQWWLFNVGVADAGEFAAGADPPRFAFSRDCAVVVQLRSMRDDEQRGLRWLYIGCNFVGTR